MLLVDFVKHTLINKSTTEIKDIFSLTINKTPIMATSVSRINSPCLVCGDKSIGFNFGVLTCMACKAFFRRNAVKLGNYDFTCPNDGDCPINHVYRRICNCCRLAKCFHVGMRKELILSEAEKQFRKERAAQHRQKREKTQAPKKSDMTVAIPEKRSAHRNYLRIHTSDQANIQNIYNAFESTCIAPRQSQYPEFPCVVHTNLCTFLNEYSKSHKVLIEYFKRLPEFDSLRLRDKIYLVRNHFGNVNNIYEAIIHPGVSANLAVSFINIFGISLANRLLQSIERIQEFSYDPVILKLFLTVTAFSSGNLRNRCDLIFDYDPDTSLSIFAAQSVYIELLWKYIMSRSSTTADAVRYFNRLVQFALYLLNVHLMVDGYITNMTEEIEQMEPLMKSMWPSAKNTNVY
ncbi:unnamed protein product [Adineta ricciae]|uniref:Nuclear receptor domain-containing protein n=2 Tax=Adineta ricciae TaxID=249248 RepID=A0A813PZV6_ADIRI|nr:unnamed protein product [Adineta ricciae]